MANWRRSSLESTSGSRDQVWLCHRGSFQGEDLCVNPFQERDLEEKDLSTDLWQEGLDQERPRKRIRVHLRIGGLARLISKYDRRVRFLTLKSGGPGLHSRQWTSLAIFGPSKAQGAATGIRLSSD